MNPLLQAFAKKSERQQRMFLCSFHCVSPQVIVTSENSLAWNILRKLVVSGGVKSEQHESDILLHVFHEIIDRSGRHGPVRAVAAKRAGL